MAQLDTLWDFEDPAGSEARLRAAAETAEGADRLVLLTQVARALGLQERYDEGHAVLDDLAAADPEVATRISLERGRLLRSAGAPEEAAPHVAAASSSAVAHDLDALHVDALHMAALVAPQAERQRLTEEALAVARAASDPAARRWEASLLTNLGMVHADAGAWPAALAAFEQARAARDDHVARWMVAWALRHLGRTEEARALQRELKATLDAAGEHDPHVDEELALLE